MKNQMKVLKSFMTIALLSLLFSCGHEKIDPALVLDEVFFPSGYEQIDNPSAKAMTRLEELRLDNPLDHFYYLKRNETNLPSSQKWIFPQRDLKIEFVDYDQNASAKQNPEVQGVIVKKIKGKWDEEVFIVVDDRPTPQGGMQALYDYISSNIQYPEEAKKSGIQGKVYVEFVVDQNGALTDVKAIRGIGAGCDEEAVRVLKESPRWNPGMVGSKPGKVRMILPISYKLS